MVTRTDLAKAALEAALLVDLNEEVKLPPEIIRERQESRRNTYDWWFDAHRQRTPHHERYSGYCPRCLIGEG